MVALDLRFVQDKAEDGSLIYRLDPYVSFLALRWCLINFFRPVDVFVTYDGKRSSDIAISRYAIRQLVANEVGVHIISFDTLGVTNIHLQRSMRERPCGRQTVHLRVNPNEKPFSVRGG